jgi:ABC-three component (ABC-3C) system Middle Component 6
MLLPDKHIRLSESILGVSAFALQRLDTSKSIDDLLQLLDEAVEAGTFPTKHGIDHISLAATFLYAIGLLKQTDNGSLIRCD